MQSLRDWAQLVRIPNTFTACADVLAGFAIIAGVRMTIADRPVAMLLCSGASICLYWAGMVLNDVYDVVVDRENRRRGPLVDNRISLATANMAGWSLVLAGVVLAGLSSLVLQGDAVEPFRWIAAPCVAFVLAATIVAYDGKFKRTPVAPLLMGLCRGLNMLMGMAVAWTISRPQPDDLNCAVVAMTGHILYVTGITIAARRESDSLQSGKPLKWGWGVSCVGVGLIAVCSIPSSATTLRLAPTTEFPGLIVILMMPWVLRAWQSIRTGDPRLLGAAIKQAIVSILFLDAALAVQFSGNFSGILLCSLIVPTLLLGRVFRTT